MEMRHTHRLKKSMLSRIKRKVKFLAKSSVYKVKRKQLIHFLHIGKTGGSAIKVALSQYPVGSRYVVCLHGHDVTLPDIPKGDYVIFAVRDPISRFVSGFYSRKRQGQPRGFSPWKPEEREAFKYFSTPNQLAVAISSQNMEERDRAYKAMTCIGHVRTSYWDWFKSEEYFRSRLSDIFFIGFQERLTESFEILKSKLDIPEKAHLPDNDILAHKTPDDCDKTLTVEAVENLKKWYKDDFEFIALCEEVVREQYDRRTDGSQKKISF